jgi:hypothetical protein
MREPIRLLVTLYFARRDDSVKYVVLWDDESDIPPSPSSVSVAMKRYGLWAEPNKRIAWDDSRVESMSVEVLSEVMVEK